MKAPPSYPPSRVALAALRRDDASAGDSGNDRDMLLGQTAGIVVGNYDKELEPLRQARYSRVYFADANYADGIIEGLRHYGLLTAAATQLAV